MQQLSITLLAVLGMIVPVLAARLEKILLAIANSRRLAPLPWTAARCRQRYAASIAAARPGHPNRPLAVFWRSNDVDKPPQPRYR